MAYFIKETLEKVISKGAEEKKEKKAEPKATASTPQSRGRIMVSKDGASPKAFPKKRTEEPNKYGEKETVIRDSEGKVTFRGKVDTKKPLNEISNFKKDSVSYENSAKYDANEFNKSKLNTDASGAQKKKTTVSAFIKPSGKLASK